MVRRFLTLAIVLAIVSPALADDMIPPPWDRYTPNTVFAHFMFNSPADDQGRYVAEDFWQFSTFEDPWIDTYYGDADWLDSWEGRDGVLQPWEGDVVQMHLDNYNCYNPVKYMYIQVTWWTDGAYGDQPLPEVFDAYSSHGDVTWSDAELTHQEDLGGGWMYDRWYIEMWPNPEWEWINFYAAMDGDMFIDQIVVDTLCIPAPGALAILGLAGFARQRRRR